MSFVGARSHTATIAAAASLSDAVELNGADVLRITMPAAWTAAEITFQVSDDGGANFRDLYMEWGFELGAWAEAGISIEASIFLRLLSIDQIKIRSGTSGAPVAQVAEREILIEAGAKSS